MDRGKATPELRARYEAALRDALLAGYEVLMRGGEAMDAVVAAVAVMEGQCGISLSLSCFFPSISVNWLRLTPPS